jgi:hypothetical protein
LKKITQAYYDTSQFVLFAGNSWRYNQERSDERSCSICGYIINTGLHKILVLKREERRIRDRPRRRLQDYIKIDLKNGVRKWTGLSRLMMGSTAINLRVS